MMSSRGILNVTSRKKRDNMMPIQTDQAGAVTGTGARTIGGDGRVTIIWCPTARSRGDSDDGTARAVRETDTCYWRGIKEKINFRTNTSVAWKWRRIVFATKGLNDSAKSSGTTLVDSVYTSQGWVRAMVDLSSAAATGQRNFLESHIFEGRVGVDWWTPFTAKVDTKRVTVLADRTKLMSSGNQSGRYFMKNQWIPINKNIVYDNDEDGEGESVRNHSTNGKPGLGDVYILDFFECSSGASVDQLLFEPQATVYWHEK